MCWGIQACVLRVSQTFFLCSYIFLPQKINMGLFPVLNNRLEVDCAEKDSKQVFEQERKLLSYSDVYCWHRLSK